LRAVNASKCVCGGAPPQTSLAELIYSALSKHPAGWICGERKEWSLEKEGRGRVRDEKRRRGEGKRREREREIEWKERKERGNGERKGKEGSFVRWFVRYLPCD